MFWPSYRQKDSLKIDMVPRYPLKKHSPFQYWEKNFLFHRCMVVFSRMVKLANTPAVAFFGKWHCIFAAWWRFISFGRLVCCTPQAIKCQTEIDRSCFFHMYYNESTGDSGCVQVMVMVWWHPVYNNTSPIQSLNSNRTSFMWYAVEIFKSS